MLTADLIGFLGADAEVRRGNDGFYTSMSIAHKIRKTNSQTGEAIDTTIWVSVTFNRDLGELVKYLKRGTQVYVRGNLMTRLYMGHDGYQHAGLNIYGHDIQLCSSRTTFDDVAQFLRDNPEALQKILQALNPPTYDNQSAQNDEFF